MARARIRKILWTMAFMVFASLAFVLILVPLPDLSNEMEIAKRIVVLRERIRSAELINVNRHHVLQNLFRQFSEVVVGFVGEKNVTAAATDLRLDPDGHAMLSGASEWTYDLTLPSIVDWLPHLGREPDGLQLAYKSYSGRRRVKVTVSIGIPTVRRTNFSYLESTLKSVFDNVNGSDANECLVIVLIAESDKTYVEEVAKAVRNKFRDQMVSGMLEIVAPPPQFYPDFNKLRLTLGDDLERVRWRSKQNLDYAFLMMYARHRSTYYVQLEDDVITKHNFLRTMLDVALEYSVLKKPWFLIDFCQLGFIGKLFRSADLPVLIQFFIMFHNDKPVDWLVDDVLNTMVCSPSHNCRIDKDDLRIRYRHSLFQHIGKYSSLKGKVQNLQDKQFGKVPQFIPHKNPPVAIETSIRHYKRYSISRAYRGETFYWGLAPQSGDTITFNLTPPVQLAGVKFSSGNTKHPLDKLVLSTVEVLFERNVPESSGYTVLKDGYTRVGEFNENGIADIQLTDIHKYGVVRAVRISVHATSAENWVVLSEIHLKVAPPRILTLQ